MVCMQIAGIFIAEPHWVDVLVSDGSTARAVVPLQQQCVLYVVSHIHEFFPHELALLPASSTWGCGAFYGDAWFQLQWPAAIKDSHINRQRVTAHYYSCRYLGSPVG